MFTIINIEDNIQKNIHCDENYIGGTCYHPTEIGFLQLHQNRHVIE